MQTRAQDALGEATSQAEEVLAAVRTVKTFSNEAGEERRYAASIEETLDCGRKQAVAEGAFQAAIGAIIFNNVGFVLWVGGRLALAGDMTVGSLVSFLFYTIQLAASLAFIGGLTQDFAKAMGATVRIFGILDEYEAERDKKETSGKEQGRGVAAPEALAVPSEVEGRIEFKSVQFNYPSRPDIRVLDSLSFVAEGGKTTAFVGPSGGGKSTVISLILRLYEPDDGSVSLDGTLLSLIRKPDLRSVVSIVSQEPVLMSSSILENIRYARQEASIEEVEEAAKMANAYDFIMKFPEQMHTKVGERGVRLSGGQKQRIAIARALLRRPRVLLLDEATSALDSESEAVVQDALERAQEGRTVLTIAHRLSTVVGADKIVVIEGGRVREEGSHSALMERGDLYSELVTRQNLVGSP